MFNRTGQLVCTTTLEGYYEQRLARPSRSSGGHRPRRTQRHRRHGPTVQNPGITIARTGRTHVGEAIEKGSQPHLAFGAGEGRSRQKCLPRENAKCLPAFSRSMSNVFGSAKTAGSRLAAARYTTTSSP